MLRASVQNRMGVVESISLIAYCEGAREIRTFKCDRIASVQLLDEECTIPQKFSLERHWKRQESAFKQACKEDELYPVKIRTELRNKRLFQKLEVMECMDEGKQTILTVNMYSYESACSEVWSIIDKAEILEPFELRQYLKAELKTLQYKYE